jgi:hypothetical protein
VDEIELCKLWNNVQSLTATVDTLIALVNQMLANGRKKRSAEYSTTTAAASMSQLEQQIIAVMLETNTAIGSCLMGHCNSSQLSQLNLQVISVTGQLQVVTTLSSTFETAFQSARATLESLEHAAANGPEAGVTFVATSSVPAVATTPPQAAATTLQSPAATATAATSAAGLCCWEFSYLPLADCIAACQANGVLG